ncbi:MAG TPA: 30S ribosomal protein S9 [Opitutales bacterium]|nr:30S ribosomal protein S9 [Opitutales bacterium]
MSQSTTEFLGTGRRKTATARVRLSQGAGKSTVNGRDIEDYFVAEMLHNEALRPLSTIEMKDGFHFRATVEGSGLHAQATAVAHGVSRALLQYDQELRGTLKKAGHLKRDPRERERKKPGQPGARKRFQFSKR